MTGDTFNNSVPRNVRDAGIAAAIAVALDLAMLAAEVSKAAESEEMLETPWMICARESMHTVRIGWQNQNQWGVPGGWKSTPGIWRNK